VLAAVGGASAWRTRLAPLCALQRRALQRRAFSPDPAAHTSPAPHRALQVRVPSAEAPALVRSLVDGVTSWADVAAKYPAQKAADE
jgi:hypothetical protein